MFSDRKKSIKQSASNRKEVENKNRKQNQEQKKEENPALRTAAFKQTQYLTQRKQGNALSLSLWQGQRQLFQYAPRHPSSLTIEAIHFYEKYNLSSFGLRLSTSTDTVVSTYFFHQYYSIYHFISHVLPGDVKLLIHFAISLILTHSMIYYRI